MKFKRVPPMPVMVLGLCALGPALLTGCSGGPVQTWQAEVERYVAEVGNGDPGSLMAGSHDGARFDLVGPSPSFGGTGEVNAVMLGPVRTGGALWQAMVVGDVRRSGRSEADPVGRAEVRSLQLALMRIERGRFVWVMGDAGEDLSAYTSSADADPRHGFPQPGDRWTVRVEDGVVRAIESTSGMVLEAEPGD